VKLHQLNSRALFDKIFFIQTHLKKKKQLFKFEFSCREHVIKLTSYDSSYRFSLIFTSM